MATSFPHDVIIDILLLLPAKTLLRFKCTCKSWLSYIESQSFIKTHRDLQIINQDKKVLLSSSTSDEEYSYYYIIEKSSCLRKSLADHEIDFLYSSKLPQEYLNETACIEYMSCCHGLVFMVISDGSMILWNPTTRKHHQIPKYNHTDIPPPSYYILPGVGNRLNYYCSQLGPAYSFGYDSSVDDYKILRLKREFNGHPIYVDMYSVNNKSWRTLGLLSSDWVIPSKQDSIMFGGAFHFLSHPIITNTRIPMKELMLSCCLVEEKFVKVYVPEVGMRHTNLCIVEQKLSISGFTLWGVCSKFEVWSVMNYGKNCTTTYWSRTISINLELPTPNVLGSLNILSARFVAEREVLLFTAYEYLLVSKGYLIYDTRKQQFLKIMGFPQFGMVNKLIEFPQCGIAIDHVETLVSPYPPHQIVCATS